MMSKELEVRRASPIDLPHAIELLRRHAEEVGETNLFDRAQAERHMAAVLAHDRTVMAFKEGQPIGCYMCQPIDLGYRYMPHLETVHVFVVPSERDLATVNALFDHGEAMADELGVVVVLTQLAYLAAVNGIESNGKRYETLLRRRKYRGPVNQCFARQPYVHVGIAYLYEGPTVRAGDPIRLPDVRLVPQRAAAPGEAHQSLPSDDAEDKPEAAE